MKVLDVLFQLGFENIWRIGFLVGFVDWIGLSVISAINKIKKKDAEKEDIPKLEKNISSNKEISK